MLQQLTDAAPRGTRSRGDVAVGVGVSPAARPWCRQATIARRIASRSVGAPESSRSARCSCPSSTARSSSRQSPSRVEAHTHAGRRARVDEVSRLQHESSGPPQRTLEGAGRRPLELLLRHAGAGVVVGLAVAPLWTISERRTTRSAGYRICLKAAAQSRHGPLVLLVQAIATQARAPVSHGRWAPAMRWRDVGEAVIAGLHPFAPLGTSGGFDRGAGRLDISSRTLRGSPDLLCKLRSSTRIECDDPSRFAREESGRRLDQPDGPDGRGQRSRGSEARQCACGTPEVGRWPSASGDSERCLEDVSEAGLQLARR